MKTPIQVLVFLFIFLMCSCTREVLFKKEIRPTSEEKSNWIKKHKVLSSITIEGKCLKDITIKEAILWLSDESRCTISLLHEDCNQDDPEVDPFIDNTNQKFASFSVRLKTCNFLEALDVICFESGYCWKLVDDLILVAPENHFCQDSHVKDREPQVE